MIRHCRLLVLACLALAILHERPILADDPSLTRREDVIYGRKYGTALTLDVFTTGRGANGAGIILVVSGGFFSSHGDINPAYIQPLLNRGYTVFAVVHGSQPRYSVLEIVEDMNRAVRFVRYHARDYGIDPGRIGITGASAGGHLSLMLGTDGKPGDPNARDPVDRESSRVQAVACFFPPTDFLNFGATGKEMLRPTDHGRPYRSAFDYRELNPESNLWVPITDEGRLRQIARQVSPITHVSLDDPPTLIIHGDKDTLVALQQSETFLEKMKEAGIPSKLVVKPGAGHGWPGIVKDLESFADWFDEYLKKPENPEKPKPTTGAKADAPPRKVVVGTTILGPQGAYPGLEARLQVLRGRVDEMARQAARQFPTHGLDLAILPEYALTSPSGPVRDRALPLEGPVRDAMGGLARAHRCYILAPMDLRERGSAGGTTYANAAVLFDRSGEVAGIYRKAHPVAVLGTDELEGGITPGREFPVFDCDFGRLGVQICWDVQFEDGWAALAEQGAEVVAWPSASPSTAQPASRAARHRYYVVSSTWREDATVFEPTGLIAAQLEKPGSVLVHELDLSFALLGWSAVLENGQALTEKFGGRVGHHYVPREDLGLFWSNDPNTSIGSMLRSIGLEEIDAQVERNRRLQDAARGGPATRASSPLARDR